MIYNDVYHELKSIGYNEANKSNLQLQGQEFWGNSNSKLKTREGPSEKFVEPTVN